MPGRLISPNSVTVDGGGPTHACSCPATVGYRVRQRAQYQDKIDFLPARHFQRLNLLA